MDINISDPLWTVSQIPETKMKQNGTMNNALEKRYLNWGIKKKSFNCMVILKGSTTLIKNRHFVCFIFFLLLMNIII